MARTPDKMYRPEISGPKGQAMTKPGLGLAKPVGSGKPGQITIRPIKPRPPKPKPDPRPGKPRKLVETLTNDEQYKQQLNKNIERSEGGITGSSGRSVNKLYNTY